MQNKINAIRQNIARVMVGREQVTDLILASFFAGGHVLLEDMPGTGKTVFARAMAKSMDVDFGRIQFTPDLLPGDVTGIHYYHQEKGEFIFREGPVFANLLLADEINRATPRTQSALLECMAEQQVTVDGETRKLAEPFMVIATQNPVETYGCFPLPEAQLDRFLMKLSMGSLTQAQERAMLDRFITEEPLEKLQPVATKEEVCALRKACRQVYVHEDLRTYIVQLVQSTRGASALGGMTGYASGGTSGFSAGAARAASAYGGMTGYASGTESGVSPRGTLAFLRAAQGFALVCGRDYVTPEDIKAVAVPVLAHRCIGGEGSEREKILMIEGLLDTVPVPTENWSRS